MIRSMTGFGAAVAEAESLQAAVSVRTLNHRFLDLTLHVSRRLQPLEGEIKGLVLSRVRRGRVEVSVRAAFRDEAGDVVSASRPLVAGLVRALRGIQAEHGLAGEVAISDVARFPGTLEVIETGLGVRDEQRREVLGLLAKALDGLDAMRRAEGEMLARELGAGLAAVDAAAQRIEALSEAGRAARREVVLERARALSGELGLDDSRLYQEVVRLVERSDVSEELQRLRSHVAQARGLLPGDGPSGKRLDFLAQELMREANTIGSKAASAPITQEVVVLKNEIEKFREQVQNVE